MDEIIEVQAASYAIGTSSQILITRGLGSCVAVCLYDKVRKIGALAHIMLPVSQRATGHPLRFANSALPIVIRALEGVGVDRKDLEAYIIGGASMFEEFEDFFSLGTKNIAAVEKALRAEDIPIVYREVGGNRGRSLQFDIQTGKVQFTTKYLAL